MSTRVKTAVVEGVGDRLLDLVPDAHYGALLVRAPPQVTVVEQEVNAVSLRLRRDPRQLRDAQLIAAGHAPIGADRAGDVCHLLQRPTSPTQNSFLTTTHCPTPVTSRTMANATLPCVCSVCTQPRTKASPPSRTCETGQCASTAEANAAA